MPDELKVETTISGLNRQMKLFKLPNPFLQFFDICISLMFIFVNCYKVLNTVIISNTIKMVNYPIIREWFTICLFPHDAVHKFSFAIYTKLNIPLFRFVRGTWFGRRMFAAPSRAICYWDTTSRTCFTMSVARLILNLFARFIHIISESIIKATSNTAKFSFLLNASSPKCFATIMTVVVCHLYYLSQYSTLRGDLQCHSH